MAVRQWDKYEAAVLLDACLQVERGEMTRPAAVTYVSELLRNRAMREGMEIDSSFRNKKGIDSQLFKMINCLQHKSYGYAIPKLFYETLALYESDKEAFDELVKKAAGAIPEKKETDGTFASWLSDNPTHKLSSDKIIGLLEFLSMLYLKAGVISVPILEMDSEKQVMNVLDMLRGNKSLHIHSKKKLNEYIFAVKTYLKYITKPDVKCKKEQSSDVVTTSKVEPQLRNPRTVQHKDGIIKILKNHYSYGFRLGSPIEMMRFRNYAGDDGVMIPVSDEDLEKGIRSAGMLIGGNVFAFGKEVLPELSAMLNQVFDSGVTALFMEPFMEKNREWMDKQHISTENMLKELLKKCCPDYYFSQNAVMLGERKTEQEAVAYEIHRVSGDNGVIWFTDLCKELEFIPPDKIAGCLSVSDDFVWISEGKYFLMNHFIIEDEEIAAITNFVSGECDEKGYASISDVPLDSVAEQNYELSTTALYSAVYKAVLKWDYHLNGKILTREKNSLNIVTLLKNYCKRESKCSVAAVVEKAVELTGAPNRQNVLTALYDTMVRADKDRFVSEELVLFDIVQIDKLLTEIVGDRFAPIKSVTTFTLFPPCGQSWNHYLLESFCHRFSKKYQLCVLNYNDKNAGIIAVKGLKLSYSDMLCEALMKADVQLNAEDIGNYFFENGFTAKKKYASLPEIIKRAAKMRGES